MELLGIDESYSARREDRNWAGVKEFFRKKIPELEDLRDEGRNGSGEDMLLSSVLEEIIDTLNRQLSEVAPDGLLEVENHI